MISDSAEAVALGKNIRIKGDKNQNYVRKISELRVIFLLFKL